MSNACSEPRKKYDVYVGRASYHASVITVDTTVDIKIIAENYTIK